MYFFTCVKVANYMGIKITKYGLDNFLIGIAIGLLLIALPYLLNFYLAISLVFWIVGALILLFFFWFFRDPRRNVPLLAIEDCSIVLAPADGKVIEIKEAEDTSLLKQKVYRISIFLSPLDVHVNRSPVTGEVFYYSYHPGKFLAAYQPEASEINEHTLIGIKNEFGTIAFKQIAGVLARRVVCKLSVGQKVDAGEKIGMMKFSSRMDILLPITSRIFVKPGDRVRGGETIIARLKKEFEFPNIG